MPVTLQVGKQQHHDPIAEKKHRRQARFLIESGVVFILLFFGLLLRMWAFEGALVTSGSMKPTLDRGDYILVDHREALRHSWNRNDIIVFTAPQEWDSAGQTLVKRVVGLPGETVQVFNTVLYINGQPQKEPFVKLASELNDCPRLTLGEDEYFVLGDNRDNSDDSRVNGPIHEENIRGRAGFILWPLSKWGALG